jgi:GTP-binding protein
MSFVDKVNVTLQAGNGGDGAMSFRHEKSHPLGGPDGGDGGDGGDIVLLASRNENTLAAFRYKKLLKAEHGQPGTQNKCHGKSADDLKILVPVGTVMVDDSGETVADLTHDGQEIVVARGGKGGFGNAHFVSSTRQAPRIAEKGERGEEKSVTLELKMIADVGLVGLPNAGKSTLLSVVSHAKPEIADYPFTTLHPNLGVVDIDKKTSLLFADIPGLIEGASQGKGLGDEFLRHVERTSVLLHLIDAYTEDLKSAYQTIIKELAAYQSDLSKRPQIVVLTKIDGLDKKELASKLKSLNKIVPKGVQVLAISSISGEGVKELLRASAKVVIKLHKKMAKKAEDTLPVISLKEDESAWKIEKQGDTFVVTGKKIERFAMRTRFEDYHSQQRLWDIMAKMGIMRELAKQDAESGQKIIIGNPPIGGLEY